MTATTISPEAMPVAAPRRSRTERLRWEIKDALVLTRRGLQRIRHEPMQLSDVTFQPVLFVLLFSYVFGAGMKLGAEQYREYLVGGMFAFIIVQAAPGTTIGIVTDMSTGVIDRFRSLPMSRSAVLAGRTLADLCCAALAVLIVAITGLFVGWSANNGLGDTLAAVGILLLFGYAVSWAGATLGMLMTNVETAQAAAFMIFLPLTFVSNAFVPTNGMPEWMQTFADWNPVSTVATACRELFGNPNPAAASDAWPMQHAILASILWSIALIAVFAPLAVRLYRRRAAR